MCFFNSLQVWQLESSFILYDLEGSSNRYLGCLRGEQLADYHYFSLPAKWVTSAEVLILNVISEQGKGISELHKGRLAQQIFPEHRIHTPVMPRC